MDVNGRYITVYNGEHRPTYTGGYQIAGLRKKQKKRGIAGKFLAETHMGA
jgi:hypothetical protein